MISFQDMSEFDGIIAGWEMSVTLQLRTPLKWLKRNGEFHAGSRRPIESLPPEHACWVPVPKTWRELSIDVDELPETTIASQIGQIPVDGGDFLPFLIDYRMIVENGVGTLAELANRYPQYREVIFPPPRRKRRARTRGAPQLSISILDYAEIPGSEDQFHFNFEFHCTDCGGYLISAPDADDDLVRCTAFDTLAKIKDACRTIAMNELRARKLGVFRDG